MTREEIMALEQDALEQRSEELRGLLDTDGADLDAIEAEVNAIEERRAQLTAERETRRADMEAVASGIGETLEKEEKNTMDLNEIRNSKEYINAYAKYVKTGSDKECRAILTQNAGEIEGASGPVPVPEFVEGRIRTAWERNDLLQYVNRTYFKGNIKIGFERSSTPADVHAEGTGAITEETLLLGVIEIIPRSIKKFVTISDEALDLNGQEFLDYIFDEIEYRILQKAVAEIIAAINAAPTTSTATAAAVKEITAAPAANTAINAAALLSGEAQNPIIVLNRQTYAAFKGITTTDGYLIQDPFDGMTPVFTDALPAYSTAASGAVYAIVGDFSGMRVNLPNGEEVTFKFDELSLAEQDLVKVVGRMYAGIAVEAEDRFVRIKKA